MGWDWISHATRTALDVLVGCRCAGCGRGASGNPCAACRDAIAALPVARQAAVLDVAPVSVVVRRAKRGDWRGGGDYLGLVLARRLRAQTARGIDLVTWVAPEPRRRRTRGGHLPERLARRVGRELGVQARPLLVRRAGGPTQQGRDRAARRRNAGQAYALRDPGVRLDGLRVLLVDDVRTTGATLEAAARVLRGAGATVVAVAAVGRGDPLVRPSDGVGSSQRAGNFHSRTIAPMPMDSSTPGPKGSSRT